MVSIEKSLLQLVAELSVARYLLAFVLVMNSPGMCLPVSSDFSWFIMFYCKSRVLLATYLVFAFRLDYHCA